NAREAEAELFRSERLETVAIAESSVERVVVRPGQWPIVAAFGGAANGFNWRPADFLDERSRRWERRHPCRRAVIAGKLAGKDAGAPNPVFGERFTGRGDD